MAVELASIFLSKPVEWAIGKALDVVWSCITCSDRQNSRIGNVMHNDLFCPNCHANWHQFTNACQSTVLKDGKIAHVGVAFNKSEYLTEGNFFSGYRNTGICVSGEFLFDGLAGQQLVEVNEVVDLETRKVFHREKTIWKPKSNRDRRPMYMNAMFEQLPDELSGGTVIAFDTRVETRFGEVLLKDRFLEKL